VPPRDKPTRRSSSQALLTILFTDIESSVLATQRLGDDKAQEIVRAHNTMVRKALELNDGSEVKHTGDGIMATFPSATRAVSSAIAIQEASREYNQSHHELAFGIRVGLNAGEPVSEDEDVFGTAVQLAARVCARAGAGQILASDVVRQLVAGKGILFEDLGRVELKGFGQRISLFEVRAEAAAGSALGARRRRALSRLPRKHLLSAGLASGIAVGAVVAVVVFAASGRSSEKDGQAVAPEMAIEVLSQTTLQLEDLTAGFKLDVTKLDDPAAESAQFDKPEQARRRLDSYGFVLGRDVWFLSDAHEGTVEIFNEVWLLNSAEGSEAAFVSEDPLPGPSDREVLPEFANFGDESVGYRFAGPYTVDGKDVEAKGYLVMMRVGQFLGVLTIAADVVNPSQDEALAFAAALESRMEAQASGESE